MNKLPLPPLEFRRLVGPTEPEAFDNPSGQPVFGDLGDEVYSNVLDFGCGCGRVARQLIQQASRPRRYLGIDRHKGMIEWCQANLAPQAPGFDFEHHNVFHELLNPQGTQGRLPLPAADKEITLFVAVSVFTHLVEPDAESCLREVGRILSPGGMAVTTWFLFDKQDYPMMQEFQNALFISSVDPANAVIFDRGWLSAQVSDADLMITGIIPPNIRGFQWTLYLERKQEGRVQATFPEDLAPRGLNRPPLG